ncbi:MAG: class I tRNA ligase family protein, partial [Ruminococcus sp.]|nr:class I tRNA ligase family protein [Ruminococcus sp.]
RYPENTRDDVPFGEDTVNKFMPVDKYVGGIEHAAMHLLYCRFIYKALRDMGYVKGDEPYPSLVHQGVIFGPDGARMSKSRGNTVAPDEYVSKYGSDVFRTYLAFGFEYSAGGAWKDSGIEGISTFFRRFTRMVESFIENQNDGKDIIVNAEADRIRHKTIKAVTNDVENFHFNTAIARLMEFCTAIIKYQSECERNSAFERSLVEDFIKMIGIFAPHYGEELWEAIGNEYSLFNQDWCVLDESKTVSDQFELAVQVCGKIKDKMMVAADSSEEEIKAAALSLEKVKAFIGDKPVRKVIVIKNRLVNIVV